MQIDQKFLKNYKEAIIGGILIVLALIVGFQQIIQSAGEIKEASLENRKNKEKVKEVNKKLADIESAKKKMLDKQNKMKPVFDPKTSAEDSIASFGGMFEDIIDYLKMNGIKLRSVEYKINPSDDPIYGNFPTLYNVCKVKLFVIGTYTQLEGLLRDLTVYPYFINISEVNIVPYEKNKQYLLINLSVTLYSKKQQGVGSVMNDM